MVRKAGGFTFQEFSNLTVTISYWRPTAARIWPTIATRLITTLSRVTIEFCA